MDDAGDSILRLDGRIDREWMVKNGQERFARFMTSPPKTLTIDCSKVQALDSTAAGILGALCRRIRAAGGECRIDGANESVAALLQAIDAAKEEPAPTVRPGSLDVLGRSVVTAASEFRESLYYMGRCLASIPWGFAHMRQVRWVDWVRCAANSGLDALLVNVLLGFIVGWIIAYEVLPPMQQYGASFVMPNVMGVAIIRELGPLITAILIAGRSGSAYAAELGTMKVTQELDAYTTFGIDPVRFLVAPRILALMFTMPLLSWFMSIAGLLGGYVVLVSQTDMTMELYMQGIKSSVGMTAFGLATFKVVIFGFIVGAVGCVSGLRTSEGPSAVGDSATRAVVTSIVLLVITDGIFAAIFYALKI
jgi:phospholipid/cholesterol/gamma-HCH transport system permease protein